MGFAGVLLIFILAVAGVVAGTRLAEVPKYSNKVLAASGVMLIAVSLIWVVPEAASQVGWWKAAACVGAGFALIWAIDHFVYPICPSCSHTHDHEECGAPLHGFATPLLVAIGVHSFLDGWGLAATQQSSDFVRVAFLFGIGLHKLPEGLALGAIVRASMASNWKSRAASIAAEAMTLVGGAAGLSVAARMGAAGPEFCWLVRREPLSILAITRWRVRCAGGWRAGGIP